MYCEDCGSTVSIRIAEYVDRKEKLGVVLCHSCRNDGVTRAGRTPAPSLH